MNAPRIIAVDGPAASGKSTLGKKLADALGYLFFDSGVMYRAVTYLALQRGVPVDDENAITALAENALIDIRPPSRQDGRSFDVWVDGQDVTWEMMTPVIDAHVSQVSAYSRVRLALTNQLRRVGLRGQVVMAGRDIGTVVLPEADLKIYLDASVEERARRRYAQLLAHAGGDEGQLPSMPEVLDSMRRRDRLDSTRQIAPLRPAADAVIVSSDGLDADQVLSKVREIIADCP